MDESIRTVRTIVAQLRALAAILDVSTESAEGAVSTSGEIGGDSSAKVAAGDFRKQAETFMGLLDTCLKQGSPESFDHLVRIATDHWEETCENDDPALWRRVYLGKRILFQYLPDDPL